MLVLRRKAGESIIIARNITVLVLAVEGERLKIGIIAPSEITIVRGELLEPSPKIEGQNQITALKGGRHDTRS